MRAASVAPGDVPRQPGVPGSASLCSTLVVYRRKAWLRLLSFCLCWLVACLLMLVGSKHVMGYTVHHVGPAVTSVHISTKAKDSAPLWPFAPADSADATDSCTILVANPCKSRYAGPHRSGCQKSSLTGFGFQSIKELGTTLNVEMKPARWWSFLPETWTNEGWCNALLVKLMSARLVTCHDAPTYDAHFFHNRTCAYS